MCTRESHQQLTSCHEISKKKNASESEERQKLWNERELKTRKWSEKQKDFTFTYCSQEDCLLPSTHPLHAFRLLLEQRQQHQNNIYKNLTSSSSFSSGFIRREWTSSHALSFLKMVEWEESWWWWWWCPTAFPLQLSIFQLLDCGWVWFVSNFLSVVEDVEV